MSGREGHIGAIDDEALFTSGGRYGCLDGAAPRRYGRVLRTLIAIGLVLSLAFAAGFWVFVRSLERAERDPSQRADGIVALTGGAQRIGDAIDLLAKGYGTRLLITGVNAHTSREEIARLNPGQRRWFECCVDLDYRARNTIGNAIETRRWIRDNGFGSVIVVTSNYHMPRTLAELDHVLPETSKVPYSVITNAVDLDRWWFKPATTRLLLSEYVKFLAVGLRTRIESDPEQSRFAVMLSREKPVKMVAQRMPPR